MLPKSLSTDQRLVSKAAGLALLRKLQAVGDRIEVPRASALKLKRLAAANGERLPTGLRLSIRRSASKTAMAMITRVG